MDGTASCAATFLTPSLQPIGKGIGNPDAMSRDCKGMSIVPSNSQTKRTIVSDVHSSWRRFDGEIESIIRTSPGSGSSSVQYVTAERKPCKTYKILPIGWLPID